MAIDIWREIQTSKHLDGRVMTEVCEEAIEDTFRLIINLSQRCGVNTLLCGSFSLQVLSGVNLSPQDLDFFIASPQADRLEFQKKVSQNWEGEHPAVDFSSLVYGGGRVAFENKKCFLRNSGINVEINPKVFEPIVVDYHGISVPVMHPQTQLALMLISEQKLEKIHQRMAFLVGMIQMGFDKYESEDFDGFYIYKQKLDTSLITLINQFRREKYNLELVGNNDWYTKAKMLVKEHAPDVYERVRSILD